MDEKNSAIIVFTALGVIQMVNKVSGKSTVLADVFLFSFAGMGHPCTISVLRRQFQAT